MSFIIHYTTLVTMEILLKEGIRIRIRNKYKALKFINKSTLFCMLWFPFQFNTLVFSRLFATGNWATEPSEAGSNLDWKDFWWWSFRWWNFDELSRNKSINNTNDTAIPKNI